MKSFEHHCIVKFPFEHFSINSGFVDANIHRDISCQYLQTNVIRSVSNKASNMFHFKRTWG